MRLRWRWQSRSGCFIVLCLGTTGIRKIRLRLMSMPRMSRRDTRCIRKKCEICHAYNGSGKTEIGAGQYPRPPDLRQPTIQNMSDGEIFFHITNGIRHTGMPAWELPERQAWQLVLYIRNLPKVAAPDRRAAGFKTVD